MSKAVAGIFRLPAIWVALATCYWLTAQLGLPFAIPPGYATAVWPSSGIAVAALLLLGYRSWPGVWLGAVLANAITVVSLLNAIAAGTGNAPVSLVHAIAVGTGNTLEAVLAAWLFHRFLNLDSPFRRVQEAFTFAATAAVSCTVAASVGAASLKLGGDISWRQFPPNWWTWWLGDVASLMIIVPLVLGVRQRPWRELSSIQWLELAAIFVLILVASQCIFGGWLPERLAENFVYLSLIFLIWVSLRFSLVEVAVATALFSVAAIWGTYKDLGAYSTEAVQESLFDLQIFMNIYAMTGLALVGMVAVRRRAELGLRESHDQLEQLVHQRTEEVTKVNEELRQEILERKRVEEKLRESGQQKTADLSRTSERLTDEITKRGRAEKWFEQILASSPDALVIAKGNGHIILVNESAERLFGYDRDELTGQAIELLVPDCHRERHREHRAAYAAKPHMRMMGSGVELSARRKSGTVFPAEIALGPMKTDEGIFVFAAIRDITERKVAESALRDSEERFYLAVRGTNAGIWDWDLRTDNVYFSPRWKSMLGCREDEIADNFDEWQSRLHPDDRERAQQTIEDYLEGRTTDFELEHRLRHKNGEYRWILSRGAAVRDKDGKVYRMVGSHLDITDRKAAEARMRDHEAQLIAAEEIQRYLLPQAPPTLAGFDIDGECFAAEFAAGDHFDYLHLHDGSLLVVISDVCGHGVGPAILMASMHAHLRSFADTYTEVGEILGKVNSVLLKESGETRFVTMLAGRIDPATRLLTHINCGHPPGIILNAEGEVTGRLEGVNLPLGVLDDVEFRLSSPVQLNAGDVVLFYTDGIVEMESPDGSPFGLDGTIRVLRDNRQKMAAEIVESLRQAVRDHVGTDTLDDDVTMVVVKVDPDVASP